MQHDMYHCGDRTLTYRYIALEHMIKIPQDTHWVLDLMKEEKKNYNIFRNINI